MPTVALAQTPRDINFSLIPCVLFVREQLIEWQVESNFALSSGKYFRLKNSWANYFWVKMYSLTRQWCSTRRTYEWNHTQSARDGCFHLTLSTVTVDAFVTTVYKWRPSLPCKYPNLFADSAVDATSSDLQSSSVLRVVCPCWNLQTPGWPLAGRLTLKTNSQ